MAMLEKMEDVSAYSRIAMRQFPRYEKFLLAAEIRTAISEIKRLLIRAAKRYYKKPPWKTWTLSLNCSALSYERQ